MDKMLLKLICCNVFQREASWCIARSPHMIDPEYTELGEHVRAESLREIIQKRIDAAEACGKPYEAILLLYGLCGNTAVGLQARKRPLIIPRAHDCCTILLGSRRRFVEHFGHAPSTPFSSVGYLERGEYFLRTAEGGQAEVAHGDSYKAMVEQYGEEDAKFIWEQMHPKTDEKAVFIDLPQTQHLGAAERFAAKAQEAGKECVRLDGDIRLIEGLLSGEWSSEEYLVVQPGQSIQGVYDFEEIVRAK